MGEKKKQGSKRDSICVAENVDVDIGHGKMWVLLDTAWWKLSLCPTKENPKGVRLASV